MPIPTQQQLQAAVRGHPELRSLSSPEEFLEVRAETIADTLWAAKVCAGPACPPALPVTPAQYPIKTVAAAAAQAGNWTYINFQRTHQKLLRPAAVVELQGHIVVQRQLPLPAGFVPSVQEPAPAHGTCTAAGASGGRRRQALDGLQSSRVTLSVARGVFWTAEELRPRGCLCRCQTGAWQ